MQTVCVTGANLSVGSRVSLLIFSLLVVELSLVIGILVLMPIVLRDTHGLVPGGKREQEDSWSGL